MHSPKLTESMSHPRTEPVGVAADGERYAQEEPLPSIVSRSETINKDEAKIRIVPISSCE